VNEGNDVPNKVLLFNIDLNGWKKNCKSTKILKICAKQRQKRQTLPPPPSLPSENNSESERGVRELDKQTLHEFFIVGQPSRLPLCKKASRMLALPCRGANIL